MNSTNPTGSVAVFWQVFPASGLARFDTVEEAATEADALLSRAPSATIIRQ